MERQAVVGLEAMFSMILPAMAVVAGLLIARDRARGKAVSAARLH